jgi:arylsulfatase A-like enzyme
MNQFQIKTIVFKLLSFGFLCIGFLSNCSSKSNEKKPNIVIFFTDDQGYADVGVYGAEGFETPNLDKLATEGIRFTNFYVAATVCTPSRVALLTGKYPKRVGLHESVIFPFSTHGLDPKEITLAELLKEQGYTTSIVGKWHLGHEAGFMPNDQGFDSFYGVPYSNDMDSHYYKHNDFQSPPLPFYRDTIVIGEGLDQRYLTKMYTEETVSQIKNRDQEKPFFIYVAHNMPHTPLYASENFKGKSELGIYGDVIMELDWSAGEIIKTLKEERIFDNTIFVFTSDNGPRVGSAKPLRGKKAETWDGGQRVPAIITWPNKIPKGVVSDALITSLDLFPTIAQISQAPLSDSHILDGHDISNFLENPSDGRIEQPFYFFSRDGILEAMRLGKWKLHVSKGRGWNKKTNGDFPVSLYNLESDIGEQDNVATQYPEVVEKLKQQLQDFNNSLEN